MNTVYTVELVEEGLRCEGFYSVSSMEELFRLLRWYKESSDRAVTVRIRKHEIEHACDVCGSGSIREEITLVLIK